MQLLILEILSSTNSCICSPQSSLFSRVCPSFVINVVWISCWFRGTWLPISHLKSLLHQCASGWWILLLLRNQGLYLASNASKFFNNLLNESHLFYFQCKIHNIWILMARKFLVDSFTIEALLHNTTTKNKHSRAHTICYADPRWSPFRTVLYYVNGVS